GASGTTVVIEEFLVGEEVSFFALVSDRSATPLAAAQDHKAVFDGDRGPNTGGMGAFTPVASFDAAMQARVMTTIVRPTVTAMADAGSSYSGGLVVQLMLSREGRKVVEFNCRFGDPECQAILAPMDLDVLPLLVAVASGTAVPDVSTPTRAAVCVAVASGGYPGAYATGVPITGVDDAAALPRVQLFPPATSLP